MAGFEIAVRARLHPDRHGLIELTVNEYGALGLILALSKEHYHASCGVLAALAQGIDKDELTKIVSNISGVRRNTKEGRLFRERGQAIVKEMVGEGHLDGRIPPSVERDENGLLTVTLTPLEFHAFAVDCGDMAGESPKSAADLMRYIAAEADRLLTPAQKLAAALWDEEPVNHDRSQ